VLVVSLLLDIAGFVIGMRSGTLEAANEGRRPLVEDIEESQKITDRILELGVKRLLPIEMLALVNEKRPATVEFTNVHCELKKPKDSVLTKPIMTVDARTPNAGDISDFLEGRAVPARGRSRHEQRTPRARHLDHLPPRDHLPPSRPPQDGRSPQSPMKHFFFSLKPRERVMALAALLVAATLWSTGAWARVQGGWDAWRQLRSGRPRAEGRPRQGARGPQRHRGRRPRTGLRPRLRIRPSSSRKRLTPRAKPA
jgi:hypothetical protein